MYNLESKREHIIIDRINFHVEIEPMEFDDMANRAPAESTRAILCKAQMSSKKMLRLAQCPT